MTAIKCTRVFYENLKAFNDNYDVYKSGGNDFELIVNQGGQGSSKTISILQVLEIIWSTIPNLRITVVSFALPHLKAGAISDFKMILRSKGMNPDDYYLKSEYTFQHQNKSFIEFVGIEGNLAKATGPRRDILYVNEANKRIGYEVFELMNARTHICTFIDYNPTAKFWFHDEVRPNFKHQMIRSTYIDNPYLPERERANLLSKRDNPKYANWWKVYGLGELGQLEGAILKNWSYGLFDDNLPFGYGMDFGVKHPDGLVKCAIDKANSKIYWHEELYETGLSTDQLSSKVLPITGKNKLIVADSSASRTILDLKAKGLNIKPVVKNRIIEDIKLLQGYEIIITEESYNLADNLNNWLWLDKRGEVPMDINDDLIDAGRYYTCPRLYENKKKGHRLL